MLVLFGVVGEEGDCALTGATFILFVANHVCSVFKQLFSCVVAVGILLCVDVMVTSSAYDIRLTLVGVGGVLCM